MAEFQLIQERNISGTGVLRVPSDITRRRLVILYASVLRPPRSSYGNFNYNPPRSRYAFMTFLRNGYVLGDGSMEYMQQSYDTVADITSQNLIAIKCMYKGLLQSFVNFGLGISGTPGGLGFQVISVDNLIQDFEYLDLAWDEVRVRCYADTAINLRLYTLPHDSCDDQSDRARKPPAPPPPPPPVPPGTPLDIIDPPYEDNDNPDNVTQPFPGDDDSPPPVGEPCTEYDIVISYTDFSNITQEATFRLFGVIDGAGLGGDGAFIFINAQGGRDSLDPPAGACLPDVVPCAVLGSTAPTYSSVSIVSITQV